MTSERPESAKSPSLPPPWFIRLAWAIHRAMYRVTGGRRGLWKPKPGKWGTMKLTTLGRKTGKERVAQALHRTSHRRNRIFHADNCSAIPYTILE